MPPHPSTDPNGAPQGPNRDHLWEEAALALAGTWEIARRDPKALERFGTDADAFWRSFGAIFFTIPFFVFMLTAEWRMLGELNLAGEVAPLAYTIAQTVSYVLGWAAFPLAMIPFLRLVNAQSAYAPFIIVYNWSNVLVIAVMSAPFLLYSFGVLPSEGVGFFMLLLLVASLVYRFEVARRALNVQAGVAMAVVAVDFFLSLLLSAFTEQMLPIASGA